MITLHSAQARLCYRIHRSTSGVYLCLGRVDHVPADSEIMHCPGKLNKAEQLEKGQLPGSTVHGDY